jgi:hypothetical protein
LVLTSILTSAKLQCEQGALFSYREAQTNLEKINCSRRSINNHTRIKSLTNQVGARFSQETLREPSPQECAAPAAELIVQVDGGHIPVKEKGKRSFEALSAIAYQPDNLKQVDKHHRQITHNSCVVSAIDDEMDTIKRFVLHAVHKQGMTERTRVTGLADGANNCWSVLRSLESHCQDLKCILDWFHIGKKFENVKNTLGEAFGESLDNVKWTLWQGKAEEALTKLRLIQDNLSDDTKRAKIQRLHDYLKNNLAYFINYEQQKSSGRVYTSQVAESHIDSLINARHKRKKKMQWTREGAHNVLQIRAKMVSQEWSKQWQDIVLDTLISTA